MRVDSSASDIAHLALQPEFLGAFALKEHFEGLSMSSRNLLLAVFSLLLMPVPALADASAAGVINSGDTAWMLTSTALVLIMTPGLAFFYAGMVRTKNVVSTLYQNFIALGVIGVLWAIIGYSLAFSSGIPLIGDLSF